MKLDKDTRKRLLADEAVELTYPPSENPPLLTGHSYAISTGNAKATSKCRVVRQERTEEGWQVVIVRDRQVPPRLLGRYGDYTDFEGRAVRRGDGPGAEPVHVGVVSAPGQTTQNGDGRST